MQRHGHERLHKLPRQPALGLELPREAVGEKLPQRLLQLAAVLELEVQHRPAECAGVEADRARAIEARGLLAARHAQRLPRFRELQQVPAEAAIRLVHGDDLRAAGVAERLGTEGVAHLAARREDEIEKRLQQGGGHTPKFASGWAQACQPNPDTLARLGYWLKTNVPTAVGPSTEWTV